MSILPNPGDIPKPPADMAESMPNRSMPKSNPSRAPSNALLPVVTCVATEAAPVPSISLLGCAAGGMGELGNGRYPAFDVPSAPPIAAGVDPALFMPAGVATVKGGGMADDTGGRGTGMLMSRPSAMSFSRSTSCGLLVIESYKVENAMVLTMPAAAGPAVDALTIRRHSPDNSRTLSAVMTSSAALFLNP